MTKEQTFTQRIFTLPMSLITITTTCLEKSVSSKEHFFICLHDGVLAWLIQCPQVKKHQNSVDTQQMVTHLKIERNRN